MNNTTLPEFVKTVKALEKKGFRWDGEDDESVFMSRKRGASTNYAQVDCFDGETITVNGETLAGFLAEWG